MADLDEALRRYMRAVIREKSVQYASYLNVELIRQFEMKCGSQRLSVGLTEAIKWG